MEQYDVSIFSMPDFAQRLPIPAIYDGAFDRSAERQESRAGARRNSQGSGKYGIDPARPILTQISRFDRLKDPVGVIACYRIVKRRRDCQLVLAGRRGIR